MSLRHLYKDLNGLGVYPDLIDGDKSGYMKLDEVKSCSFINNKYYGKKGISIDNNPITKIIIMKLFDCKNDILHDIKRPSSYVISGDVDAINMLIKKHVKHDKIIKENHYISGKCVTSMDYRANIKTWLEGDNEHRDDAPSGYRFYTSGVIITWRIKGRLHEVYPGYMTKIHDQIRLYHGYGDKVHLKLNQKFTKRVSDNEHYTLQFHDTFFRLTHVWKRYMYRTTDINYDGDIISKREHYINY